MCIHSDETGLFPGKQLVALVWLSLLWLTTQQLIAQPYPVRINMAVMPPYSTKISDYTSQPNKVYATLQYTSIDAMPLSIYLRGEISSSSGIRIYTRPEYRPGRAILLQPGSIYTINLRNIQDVFDTNQLIYAGISQNEIIYGNGLPEGVYVICLRAYDYYTDQPLSDETPFGCSSPFSVASIEPPVIMQPFCYEEILATSPQNVIFSWTMPAGASPTTMYRIRMVEVVPDDHNINNAMQPAVAPFFFETTLSGNVFLYGPAQPALVTGKRYAFTVSAFDPLGKRVFRNGGRSEVYCRNNGT